MAYGRRRSTQKTRQVVFISNPRRLEKVEKWLKKILNQNSQWYQKHRKQDSLTKKIRERATSELEFIRQEYESIYDKAVYLDSEGRLQSRPGYHKDEALLNNIDIRLRSILCI